MRFVQGKRLTHILGFHHVGENRGGIRWLLIVKDIAAHARPMYAPDLRMMRVCDDGRRQSDLRFRKRGWISE